MSKEPAFVFVPVDVVDELVRVPADVYLPVGWRLEQLERLTQHLPGQPAREVVKVPAGWVKASARSGTRSPSSASTSSQAQPAS